MREKLLNRFLQYVQIETTSDESSSQYPSTESQHQFQRLLYNELLSIGLSDVSLDSHSYLTATIPASAGRENDPVIGFIAHVDTSADMSAHNVKPLVHENFDGTPIPLPSGHVLSPDDFPEILLFKGHTLITSSGDTLLGSDDKAGVAEIITAAEFLLQNREISHGKIRLAFTCDEEIGRGVDFFDVSAFGAAYAYTMDSGAIGLLEYENFNAASASVTITGNNIHPGYAYGKMLNALNIAHAFHSALPSASRPENTSNRAGFYHLHSLTGTVETASMHYIIREFDDSAFESMKTFISSVADNFNHNYGSSVVAIDIRDQYRNMYSQIIPRLDIVERARAAMVRVGIEPIEMSIRGGTDGSRLSFMGLPCPNIFTGGMNFHSRYEYATLDGMILAVQTIVEIARSV